MKYDKSAVASSRDNVVKAKEPLSSALTKISSCKRPSYEKISNKASGLLQYAKDSVEEAQSAVKGTITAMESIISDLEELERKNLELLQRLRIPEMIDMITKFSDECERKRLHNWLKEELDASSVPNLLNKDYYKTFGNEGFCQWYALSRAREIYGVDFEVDSGLSGSPSRAKQESNGITFQDWLTSEYPEYFKKSKEPEAGSIYCITGDDVGHVGFIRTIDEDKGTMIVEDGNAGYISDGSVLEYYDWGDYGIPKRVYDGLRIRKVTQEQFFNEYGRT